MIGLSAIVGVAVGIVAEAIGATEGAAAVAHAGAGKDLAPHTPDGIALNLA